MPLIWLLAFFAMWPCASWAENREAFLQAIREHRRDDTYRLVFSDWLEERGNGDEAEFIRIQCEIAKAKDNDPRLARLRSREAELLRAHQREWSPPEHPLVARWIFHRGFPDTAVTYRMADFQQIAEIAKVSPLIEWVQIADGENGRVRVWPPVELDVLAWRYNQVVNGKIGDGDPPPSWANTYEEVFAPQARASKRRRQDCQRYLGQLY